MSDASNIIEGKIVAGKQALSNNYIDIAIQAFQEALNVANPESSSQNSLIGIAQAYLLLASGIKGEKDDKSTVPQIAEALDLLPAETNQIKTYISLLMDIGKELQRITFFESSGIVYKKALKYSQIQGAKGDIATISAISWNLGFSYQKAGKMESAAKLLNKEKIDKPLFKYRHPITGEFQEREFNPIKFRRELIEKGFEVQILKPHLSPFFRGVKGLLKRFFLLIYVFVPAVTFFVTTTFRFICTKKEGA